MNTNRIARREIILTAAGAALSTLLCRHVSAQPAPESTLAKDAGRLHSEQLQTTSKWLGGESIISEKGLLILTDRLVEFHVIKRDEAQILKNLIEAIFHSETLDALQKKIGDIYNGVEKSAEHIVLAIVSIARDSAAYAAEKVSFQTAVKIVASDIQGALQGAGTIPIFLPIKNPESAALVAIVCILSGATSSSALAFFAKENKQ